jgi:hypothetical protein
MFQQKQGVADKILLSRNDCLLLEHQGVRIGDSAEMEKINVHDKPSSNATH